MLRKGFYPNIEDLEKTEFAEILCQFYPSACQTPKQGETEGKPYAKQSLINLRPGINQHLQMPLNNKIWNLVQDTEFLAANRVFKGKEK